MSQETSVDALRRSAREPEAFVRFYDQHSERLLAYLARRVYEPDAALDLMAESFAQAYRSRRRFRGSTEQAASAWLYRIASRQFARYVRKGKAERRALERLGVEPPRLDDDQRQRIEDLAELAELRGPVRRELEQLSAAHRRRCDSALSRSCRIQKLQISLRHRSKWRGPACLEASRPSPRH